MNFGTIELFSFRNTLSYQTLSKLWAVHCRKKYMHKTLRNVECIERGITKTTMFNYIWLWSTENVQFLLFTIRLRSALPNYPMSRLATAPYRPSTGTCNVQTRTGYKEKSLVIYVFSRLRLTIFWYVSDRILTLGRSGPNQIL